MSKNSAGVVGLVGVRFESSDSIGVCEDGAGFRERALTMHQHLWGMGMAAIDELGVLSRVDHGDVMCVGAGCAQVREQLVFAMRGDLNLLLWRREWLGRGFLGIQVGIVPGLWAAVDLLSIGGVELIEFVEGVCAGVAGCPSDHSVLCVLNALDLGVLIIEQLLEDIDLVHDLVALIRDGLRGDRARGPAGASL